MKEDNEFEKTRSLLNVMTGRVVVALIKGMDHSLTFLQISFKHSSLQPSNGRLLTSEPSIQLSSMRAMGHYLPKCLAQC